MKILNSIKAYIQLTKDYFSLDGKGDLLACTIKQNSKIHDLAIEVEKLSLRVDRIIKVN